MKRLQSRSLVLMLALMMGVTAMVVEAKSPEESLGPDWRLPPEDQVRRALGRLLGPESDFDLILTPSTRARALQGKFDKLHLVVRESRIQGMEVSHVEIDLEDLHINMPRLRTTGALRVFSAGSASYKISITEEALNWLLSSKLKSEPGQKSPRLELGKGEVKFQGSLAGVLVDPDLEVRGKLEPRNGHEVHFVPRSVRLGWIKLPSFAMNVLAGKLNPIATLAKFQELKRCKLQVKEIVIENDLLTVSG